MNKTIKELVGKTFVSVKQEGTHTLVFTDAENTKYEFYHFQDCCEEVFIEDLNGDLSDLEGTPLLVAEERSNWEEQQSEFDDLVQWTFYTFRTIRGSVDVRWYGTSNGYYSTSVDFAITKENK